VLAALGPGQRLALEAHLAKVRELRQRKPSHKGAPPGAAAPRAARSGPQGPAASHGIHKSAAGGVVYGYFAQAGAHNLQFFARLQRDVTAAAGDHLILMRIVDQLRSAGGGSADLPSRVRLAFATVLKAEGLTESEFLRGVRVSFSAHHWIGRGLFVHCASLSVALEAWGRFHGPERVRLFVGRQPGPAYTPRAAKAEWQRAREAFIVWQVEQGRGDRPQLERALAALEVQNRAKVVQTAAQWCQQQWRRRRAASSPARRSGDCPQLLTKQRLDQAQRERLRTERREDKVRQQRKRALRWDGKESLADFERRARRRRVERGSGSG